MSLNNIQKSLSPSLQRMVGIKKQEPQKQAEIQAENANVQSEKQYSPAIKNMILAQNKISVQNVNINPAERTPEYKNNLRTKFQNNEATIMAVIPRTMNAQDADGDDLITGNEVKGNFINAVGRLDEIKSLGINTLHVLPIQPTGVVEAMGLEGSLYAPGEFVAIDPNLKDPNDPRSVEEQCKYFIDECHKRGISVMLDLPSCVSVDFAQKHPELMAYEKNGNDKVPQGWQDIRMFRFWDDEENKVLNPHLLELHKQFIDFAIDLGFDGIRADVARAKPVEFWNVLIPYSRQKDPEFAWLAETYTYENASPMMNMPHDRPMDQLKAGFDSYYGQYHIFNLWPTADEFHKYVVENIEASNKFDTPKSLIGSMATHDDKSPMLNGGAPWVMLTTGVQSTLPQVNTYYVDGVQSGDTYLYKYDGAQMPKDYINNPKGRAPYVHTGIIDIFNNSRKPGGAHPEIGEFMKSCHNLKNSAYKDVINKGSYIPLETNNPKVIAYARHYNGKTLLVVANREISLRSNVEIKVPGLSQNQPLSNLVMNYGEKSQFQKEDNKLIADLGPSRFHVFEINTPNIESEAKQVYKQKGL